jgi:hypothetical protein
MINSTSKLNKELLIAEVSNHLKKGSSLNFSEKERKHRTAERYDEDGRAANRKLEKKNRRLKTLSKVDVPISNSTYKDFNNYLSTKE